MQKTPAPSELRALIEDYVSTYPAKTGEANVWRKPLLATAQADARFNILPRIAAEDHALPQDLLPSARSVVVFFVPFVKALAVENHKGEFPCRNWEITYASTNQLINSVCEHIQHYLEEQGYKATLTPATHNFDQEKLVSRWSHKHLGYISCPAVSRYPEGPAHEQENNRINAIWTCDRPVGLPE